MLTRLGRGGVSSSAAKWREGSAVARGAGLQEGGLCRDCAELLWGSRLVRDRPHRIDTVTSDREEPVARCCGIRRIYIASSALPREASRVCREVQPEMGYVSLGVTGASAPDRRVRYHLCCRSRPRLRAHPPLPAFPTPSLLAAPSRRLLKLIGFAGAAAPGGRVHRMASPDLPMRGHRRQDGLRGRPSFVPPTPHLVAGFFRPLISLGVSVQHPGAAQRLGATVVRGLGHGAPRSGS